MDQRQQRRKQMNEQKKKMQEDLFGELENILQDVEDKKIGLVGMMTKTNDLLKKVIEKTPGLEDITKERLKETTRILSSKEITKEKAVKLEELSKQISDKHGR